MKPKQKILLFVFLATLTLGILASVSVRAGDINDRWGLETAKNETAYKSGPTDITAIIGKGIQLTLGLVGFIFFGMIMYGGLRWMTARGKEELKEKAMNAITNAVLGLAIVVAAYALTSFVIGKIAPPSKTDTASVVNPSGGGETPAGGEQETNGCCTIYGATDTKECLTATKSMCDTRSGQWTQARCKSTSANAGESCNY